MAQKHDGGVREWSPGRYDDGKVVVAGGLWCSLVKFSPCEKSQEVSLEKNTL